MASAMPFLLGRCAACRGSETKKESDRYNSKSGAPEWRTADPSASLGMTKRKGLLTGRGLLPKRRAGCWGRENALSIDNHPLRR